MGEGRQFSGAPRERAPLRKFERLGLEPAWVEDLLGIWSGSDMRTETSRLGFSPVSPMFERMGESESVDTDAGYSSLEVAAVKAATERLQREHPDEWTAIQRAFRPWVRHEIEGGDDQAVLKTAAWRVAEWIDQALGD